jgi:hypothetical protein
MGIEIFGARANDARVRYQMDLARAFGELSRANGWNALQGRAEYLILYFCCVRGERWFTGNDKVCN